MTLDEARLILSIWDSGKTLRPYQRRALWTAVKIVDDAAMLIAGREEVEQMKRSGSTDLLPDELRWMESNGVVKIEQ